MRVSDLIQGMTCKEIIGDADVPITGITQDSRLVRKGFLFIAIPGIKDNGGAYIPEAIKKGASAVVTGKGEVTSPLLSVPLILVENPRQTLADLAARFYGDPSLKMRVIGITGTNGKTTLTYLLESILKACGAKPGVLGTVNYRYGNQVLPASHTTPESIDLQKTLSEMLQAGVTDVLMEVSSHSLVMERVRNIHFDVGVFTNLSQDHLDFHQDLEDYFQAKLKLFIEVLPQSQKKEKWAVLNMEDPRSEEIAILSDRSIRASLTGPYEVSCRSFQLSEEGITARISVQGREMGVVSSLLGKMNLENILLAIGVSAALGLPLDRVSEGIGRLQIVPGRLEKIPNDRGLLIFVDYAHTPDALARVGEDLRKFCRGRFLTVFGCGGDRDKTKRSIMGRETALFSDFVILTSDNPRSEDPEKILDDIVPGLEEVGYPKERLFRIASREEALRATLKLARRGDLVLVAGKGHEDYQMIGDQKLKFSDREVLKKLLTAHS